LPIMPTFTHERNVDNPKTALQQLNDMVARIRRPADGSTLSAEQAFTNVYTDPANKELAARERAEARSRLPVVGGRVL
jgi:hypothetical protein